jgi:hypothetical protein
MEIEKIAETLLRARFIPIITELRQIPKLALDQLGSIIMMGELEYRFSFYRNGFYIDDETFRDQLGCHQNDWLNNFRVIGVNYDSTKDFQAESNKFQGNFYCKFYDANQQMTGYLRNHPLVEETLKPIFGDITIAELYDEILKQNLEDNHTVIQRLESRRNG